MGGASINTTRNPPLRSLYLPFLLYPNFNSLVFMLYLLPVSQKPHTILKQVGAGLHTPFGVWLFLFLLYFRLALMFLVLTITHMTVFYSFVVKLLLTTLTPPPSPSVRTHSEITTNGKSIVYRFTHNACSKSI